MLYKTIRSLLHLSRLKSILFEITIYCTLIILIKKKNINTICTTLILFFRDFVTCEAGAVTRKK